MSPGQQALAWEASGCRQRSHWYFAKVHPEAESARAIEGAAAPMSSNTVVVVFYSRFLYVYPSKYLNSSYFPIPFGPWQYARGRGGVWGIGVYYCYLYVMS